MFPQEAIATLTRIKFGIDEDEEGCFITKASKILVLFTESISQVTNNEVPFLSRVIFIQNSSITLNKQHGPVIFACSNRQILQSACNSLIKQSDLCQYVVSLIHREKSESRFCALDTVIV